MTAPQPLLPYRLAVVRHRALGRMLRLYLADDLFVLDLTAQEAHTLALALAAVREGRSPEREIYLSPIACDRPFICRVIGPGLAIDMGSGELRLDWEQAGRLAAALRDCDPNPG